jgi:hypothetical protein
MRKHIWYFRLFWAFRRAGWGWRNALLDAWYAWKDSQRSGIEWSWEVYRRDGYSPDQAITEDLSQA